MKTLLDKLVKVEGEDMNKDAPEEKNDEDPGRDEGS